MSADNESSMEIIEEVNALGGEPTLVDIWRLLKSNSTGTQVELKEHKQQTKENFDVVQSQIDVHKRLIGDLNRKIVAMESASNDAIYEAELSKQRNLRNNVTVMGIPPSKNGNENLKSIAIKVFSLLAVNVPASGIQNVYRKGDIIVVRLAEYDTKATIIQNKTKSKILLSQIHPATKSNQQVYVNNHTTPYFGRLLQCGRNAVRDGKNVSMRLTNRGCMMKIGSNEEEILVKSVTHYIEILDLVNSTKSAPISSAVEVEAATQSQSLVTSGSGVAATGESGPDNKKKRSKGKSNTKRRNRSFESETTGNQKSKQKTDDMDCN